VSFSSGLLREIGEMEELRKKKKESKLVGILRIKSEKEGVAIAESANNPPPAGGSTGHSLPFARQRDMEETRRRGKKSL